MTTLLVRNIGELCTCDPSRGDAPGVLRNAAVLAEDGVITFVGAEHELPRAASVDVEVDARGDAVVPGFVDSHTHAVWLGERSTEYALRAGGATYEQIAEQGGGIAATVRATASGSVDQLSDAAAPRVLAMRRHGTTTVELKSGYGTAVDAEMRQLDAANRLRSADSAPDVVTTYLALHAVPDDGADAHVESVLHFGLVEARSRATFVDVFCERGAFTVEQCERVLSAAASLGMRGRVHAEQRSHSGGALLAARSAAVSADHLEFADDRDARALAAAGVVGVLLPGASLVLGGPPPPGRLLLEAGVVVAIATDCNPGTCYAESMPLMLSLAVATAGLTPAQALMAATAGGAAALQLPDRGVLRPGLRCDLAILNTRNWIDCAYHLGGDVVRDTVVAGESTLR